MDILISDKVQLFDVFSQADFSAGSIQTLIAA